MKTTFRITDGLRWQTAIMLVMITSSVFTAQPCQAGVVTSTEDAGPGTLRQEIIDANADGVPTQISFDGGVFPATIALDSRLPALHGDGDAIDANGMMVGIDGTAVLDAVGQRAIGIRVNASNVTIRGLTIHNFANNGIYVGPSVLSANKSISQVKISENRLINNLDGIHVSGGMGPDNFVEVTVENNRLNANRDDGIVVEGSPGGTPGHNEVRVVIDGNRVQGSLGVVSGGTITGDGIRVLGGNRNGSGNRVVVSITENWSFENIDDGILVAGAAGGGASQNVIEAAILGNIARDNGADTSTNGNGIVIRGGSRLGAVPPGIDNSIHFVLDGNRSLGNKDTGILISGGLGIGNSLEGAMSSNLGWRNGLDGLRITGGIGTANQLTDITVESNRLIENERDGINLNSGSGGDSLVREVSLSDNMVLLNDRFGIFIAVGLGAGSEVRLANVSGNISIANARDGLFIKQGVLGAGDTVVASNRCNLNAEDGIDIDSVGYLLKGNRAMFNTQDGINALGNTNGGSNIAWGNDACNTPGCY